MVSELIDIKERHRIVFVGVKAQRDDDCLRLEGLDLSHQIIEGLQVGSLAGAAAQRVIQIPPRGARPPGFVLIAGIEWILLIGVRVQRSEQYLGVVPEDRLRAIAMMIVDVDQCYLAGLSQAFRRQRSVVEVAVAAEGEEELLAVQNRAIQPGQTAAG